MLELFPRSPCPAIAVLLLFCLSNMDSALRKLLSCSPGQVWKMGRDGRKCKPRPHLFPICE